jgi:hypothetical protein
MFSGFTKKNGKIIMRFIFHRLSADGFSRGKEARKKIIIKHNWTTSPIMKHTRWRVDGGIILDAKKPPL